MKMSDRTWIILALGLIPSFAMTFGGERPPSAPPIDERLTGIESRVTGHDTQIADLKKQIEALQLAIKCPCGRGGKCICPPGACLCPNCPEHGKKATAESEPRVRLLHWSATWCGPCKVIEPELMATGLWNRLEHYDWDSSKDRQTASKAGVTAIPALVLEIDGKIVDRHIGSVGFLDKAKAWASVDPDTYSKPIKDSRVETQKRIVYHDDGDASDDQIRQHLVDAHGY
jgi:thiol-disulfide isomerase/thioredoxin